METTLVRMYLLRVDEDEAQAEDADEDEDVSSNGWASLLAQPFLTSPLLYTSASGSCVNAFTLMEKWKRVVLLLKINVNMVPTDATMKNHQSSWSLQVHSKQVKQKRWMLTLLWVRTSPSLSLSFSFFVNLPSIFVLKQVKHLFNQRCNRFLLPRPFLCLSFFIQNTCIHSILLSIFYFGPFDSLFVSSSLP